VGIRGPNQASCDPESRESPCATGAVDAGDDALLGDAERYPGCGRTGCVGVRGSGGREYDRQNGDEREQDRYASYGHCLSLAGAQARRETCGRALSDPMIGECGTTVVPPSGETAVPRSPASARRVSEIGVDR
jgi:hypothetical protein